MGDRRILLSKRGMVYLTIFVLLFSMTLFATTGSASSEEIILCKNVVIPDNIDADRLPELKLKQTDRFQSGDRIVAIYSFKTRLPDRVVEFRWMRQMDNVRVEERRYTHRFEQNEYCDVYIVHSWLILSHSLMDYLFGSKHAGDWVVEVYVNYKKVGEKAFLVKSN
jgi:hypothetical protein